MSLAEPLSRIGLSQQIRDRLLSRIMSGALKPGDRLVELRIAGEMATSQAPVREALRELEAMGVVETLRNKGARVRVITDDELRQIYDVRAQLEGYAAELAAAGGAPIKSKLVACIRAMRKAARQSDQIGFADHNSQFHRLIVESTGGFEYQTGISFVVFARDVRGELGRGGRYDAETVDGAGESCHGFTLYMDTVLRALPKPAPSRRIFTPVGSDPARVKELQDQDWIVVSALEATENLPGEARRLLCSHLLLEDRIEALSENLETEEE